MFLTIRRLLLVTTFISHTQTERHESTTDPNLNEIITNNRRHESSTNISQKKKWKFEDYMKKFEPSTIFEQIDKQRKYNGLILSDREKLELMIRKMDPTDEFMGLEIERGDPKIVLSTDGRRGWKPYRYYGPNIRDRLQLRHRLYELMKQAIYHTRNKMVIMQTLRTKYRDHGLYRMGYLMHKADDAAKTFGRFSFRGYRACLMYREKAIWRLPLFDLLSINERQLNLLFNLELITDLIRENDVLCRELFRQHTVQRKKHFSKQFVP